LLPIWQADGVDDDLDRALGAVGPRLRALRRRRQTTLAGLSAATGISVSTLSRLESGARRPTLELLLPLARAHGVTLDELVGAPPTGDPRIHLRPVSHHGMTVLPLTRRPGGIQAYKLVIPASGRPGEPDPKTHEGYDWLYVLDGRLRLVLGEHDLVLSPGEAAEFDTRVPHWFGADGAEPVELLSLFGRQGERAHLRARPKPRRPPGRADQALPRPRGAGAEAVVDPDRQP
jgi:transcriptional regulator with XRE-family HTH domain